MSDPYEFGSDLPIEPMPAGTNVLVAGSGLSGARQLALRMIAAGSRNGEGTTLLSIDAPREKTLAEFEAVGGDPKPDRTGIVECTTGGEAAPPDHEHVRTVATPGDLTGIGIEFSSICESLYGGGYRRIRTGLFTVSALCLYADDLRPVFRFLHTVTGRIANIDGFGVCVVDPSAQDEQSVHSVAQAFDARIDVREGDSAPELRVRGLPDQPHEWTAFERWE
jgi:hypothetical protein